MIPVCYCCGRPAVYFDRQISKWLCEGNSDCAMSKRKGDEVVISNMWNRYLAELMEQFPEAPPSPDQISLWKVNFFAGVAATVIQLDRAMQSNSFYRCLAGLKTEIEEIQRENETHIGGAA